ncbi:MAG TPA: hypothetical protein VK207_00880 [Bacteroidales bacterium]|jgi:hypothetical protein|nr:hypothetical protein [Bacteroidales bacterium]
MKKILVMVFLAVAFGLSGLTYGQQTSKDKGDWEKIGEATLNLSEDYGIFDWDRDRIESVSANEKYSAIKFKAKDAKVNLTNVEVEYENGKKEDLKLQSSLNVNSESKALPLDTRQELDKVTLNFLKDENARADKAVVEIWGLKSGASGMGQRDQDADINIDRKKDNDKDVDINIKRDKDRDKNKDINVDVDVDTSSVRVK